MAISVQDRTSEFNTLLKSSQKRLRSGPHSAHQRLLDQDCAAGAAKPKSSRGEFARRAADIGRSITATMGKLERLALLAKRKALFDDKPVEISELTYVIKQDLSSINGQISDLQETARQQQQHQRHQHKQQQSSRQTAESSEHSKNVVVMLQGKLADVSVGFKEVLEIRTANIQASRARSEKFIAGVRPASPPSSMLMAAAGSAAARSESPLYQQPQGGGSDVLSLEMPSMGPQQLDCWKGAPVVPTYWPGARLSRP